MLRSIPVIAVRRLPVVFWSSIYVDPTNHGSRRSVPSNPVDPIQPRILAKLALASESSRGSPDEFPLSAGHQADGTAPKGECQRSAYRQIILAIGYPLCSVDVALIAFWAVTDRRTIRSTPTAIAHSR